MDNKYLKKQQKPIELILFRQIASYLATPSFIVDKDETVIFCNKAAEEILRINFSERDEINVEEWSKLFKIQDEKGHPADKFFGKELLRSQHFYIESQDGKLKKIHIITLRIMNQMEEFCGHVCFFQESPFQEILFQEIVP